MSRPSCARQLGKRGEPIRRQPRPAMTSRTMVHADQIAVTLRAAIALSQVLPYPAAYRTLKPDLDFGFARRPSRSVAYQSLSFCDASHVCAWRFLCGDWRGL